MTNLKYRNFGRNLANLFDQIFQCCNEILRSTRNYNMPILNEWTRNYFINLIEQKFIELNQNQQYNDFFNLIVKTYNEIFENTVFETRSNNLKINYENLKDYNYDDELKIQLYPIISKFQNKLYDKYVNIFEDIENNKNLEILAVIFSNEALNDVLIRMYHKANQFCRYNQKVIFIYVEAFENKLIECNSWQHVQIVPNFYNEADYNENLYHKYCLTRSALINTNEYIEPIFVDYNNQDITFHLGLQEYANLRDIGAIFIPIIVSKKTYNYFKAMEVHIKLNKKGTKLKER